MVSYRPPRSEARIQEMVTRRVKELAALSFDELARFPGVAGVATPPLGARASELWTYVDVEGPDCLRVVVQLSARAAPSARSGQVYAEGFRRRRDGSTVTVVPPEIYEFM